MYLAKVKLDPKWFLLVLQGVYVSQALPSVTSPLGFAITGATLSAASGGGRQQCKGIHCEWELGKDTYPQYCLAICFTSF